jgi:hypothetical protein
VRKRHLLERERGIHVRVQGRLAGQWKHQEADVLIFKVFSPKNSQIIGVFDSKRDNFSKNLMITLFLRKTQFFRQKSSKIAENCHQNIDPRGPFLKRGQAETQQQRQQDYN